MTFLTPRNVVIFLGVILCCVLCRCDEVQIEQKTDDDDVENVVEQGRTFVHHAMKRLAILLPAFMFKLGIMFTMLLVSMITSTKSLLVGTLLLALGVGHFIANRFNAVNDHHAHAHIALPHYSAWPTHPHFVDRSDNVATTGTIGAYPASYSGYAQQHAYGAWKQ